MLFRSAVFQETAYEWQVYRLFDTETLEEYTFHNNVSISPDHKHLFLYSHDVYASHSDLEILNRQTEKSIRAEGLSDGHSGPYTPITGVYWLANNEVIIEITFSPQKSEGRLIVDKQRYYIKVELE